MDRIAWMTFKAYAPAAVLLLAAFAAVGISKGLPNLVASAPALSLVRVVSFIAFSMGLIATISATYRLRRWERGEGPMCPLCGGPLGAEKQGIRGRADYRTCMQCGKHASERFYR